MHYLLHQEPKKSSSIAASVNAPPRSMLHSTIRRLNVCLTICLTMMPIGRAFFLSSSKRQQVGEWKRLVQPLGTVYSKQGFSTLQSAKNMIDFPLLSSTDVRKMRVAELREHLQARELDVSGLKTDLVSRLLHSITLSKRKATMPAPHSTSKFDSNRTYLLRFSGFATKPTGISGCGLLLFDLESQTEVWCAREYYNGNSPTRLEAEFRGVASCLQFLHAHGVTMLILASDNSVLLGHLSGEHEITNQTLLPCYVRALAAKEQFKTVDVVVLSPTENSKSMELARRAVTSKSSFGMEGGDDTKILNKPQSILRNLDNGAFTSNPIDPSQTYLLKFGSSSRENQGVSGAGMVLYDFNTMNEVWCGWKYEGEMVTNDFASYRSLLIGLQCAKSFGVTKLIVEGDSQMIIQQISETYQVDARQLKFVYQECKEEMAGFESIQCRHIPKAENKRADELANHAMDMEESWGMKDETPKNMELDASRHNEDTRKTALPPSDRELSTDSPIKGEKTYLLKFDGGSRGNPGKCGAGMVLYDIETNDEIWCGWKYLGEAGTNNEAEYNALLIGVKCAKSLGVNHLIAEGDSNLVVKQVKGEWKVKEARLKIIRDEIIEESKAFESFEILHVRREFNARADELANQAMNSEDSFGFDECVS